MEGFINSVNRDWDAASEVDLAAYILWRLPYIHPFGDGNGRTARAAAHFAVCVKAGHWIAGEPILPVRIKNDPACIPALRHSETAKGGQVDLGPVRDLVARHLTAQRQTAKGAAIGALRVAL